MLPTHRLFPAACIAASFAMSSCAQPPQSKPVSEPNQQVRGEVSGVKQQIAEFYFVNSDCTSGGYPVLKVAKLPQHGQVSVEQGTAYADFKKDDSRAACNGKKMPATLIFYTSEPGFIGSDTVAFDRIGVLGAYGYHEYTINVR